MNLINLNEDFYGVFDFFVIGVYEGLGICEFLFCFVIFMSNMNNLMRDIIDMFD